jgi:hypothetical protein
MSTYLNVFAEIWKKPEDFNENNFCFFDFIYFQAGERSVDLNVRNRFILPKGHVKCGLETAAR